MNLILLRAQLRGLSAFRSRSLLDTPMLKDALQLLDAAARRDGEGALAAYDQMFYHLKAEGYSGLGTWMWDTLRYTETPYGDLAGSGRSDSELEGAARRDVDALLQLARLGAEDIRVALKPILTRLLPGERGRAVRQIPGLSLGGGAACPRGRPGLPPPGGAAGL